MSPESVTTEGKTSGISVSPGASARFWDAFGILLCFVLVFCATLFPARNGDLYYHMAVGRQLVQGEYNFSTDPAVYTNPDGFVNSNWLFGLTVYLIHGIPSIGPSLLVIFKAMAAVAVIVFLGKSFRLPLGRLTVPILVLGLAALGISNRWLLQPFVLSVLFFSITLYFLAHLEGKEEDSNPGLGLSFWAIPIISVLWVNFDIWFLFGPLAVTVFCIGRIVAGNSSLKAGHLALLIVLTWAACLLNPWGYKAFQLPINMRGFDPANYGWVQLYPEWFSPALGKGYLRTVVGLSPNGLAFLPLTLVGILFVIIGRSRRSLAVILVFFTFLVLGFGFSRALPFFCVAAAWSILGLCLDKPKTGPNFSTAKVSAGQKSAAAETFLFPKIGLSFLLGLGIVCAIPGWVHPIPTEDRSFGLGVIPDESLKGVCTWINEKKSKGEWDESKNLFHLSLNLSNYMAWYCPGTKGFIDPRLTLGKKAANDFFLIQQSLKSVSSPEAGKRFQMEDWKEIFQSWNIGYLVFQEAQGRDIEWMTLFLLLTGNRDNIDILRVDGSTFAATWKKPGEVTKPGAEDPRFLAFGKGAQKIEDAPPFKDPILTLWNALFPEVPRPQAKDYEAHLRFIQFTSLKRAPINWLNCQIALMALSGSSDHPLQVANPTAWLAALGVDHGRYGNAIAFAMQNAATQLMDEADPAYLYLALRASRLALLSQINDPKAWFRLGQGYEQLNNQTLERNHFRSGAPMALIRRYQTISALVKAAKTSQSPDDLRIANELLMQIYGMEYPDRTLSHMRDYLEVIKTSGLNMPPSEIEEVLNRLQGNMANLEKEVESRMVRFENEVSRIERNYPGSSALGKLRTAFELGLLNTARELINTPESREQAAIDSTGQQAMQMSIYHLQILINLGDVDAAAALLTDDFKDRLGTYPNLQIPAYEWYQVMVAACQGRYQVAEGYLKESQQAVNRSKLGNLSNLRDITLSFPKTDQFTKMKPEEMISLHLARAALAGSYPIQGFTAITTYPFDFRLKFPLLNEFGWNQTLSGYLVYLENAITYSEIEVCRGFLKLESGDVEGAKGHFTKALEQSTILPSGFVVRKFLEKMP